MEEKKTFQSLKLEKSKGLKGPVYLNAVASKPLVVIFLVGNRFLNFISIIKN